MTPRYYRRSRRKRRQSKAVEGVEGSRSRRKRRRRYDDDTNKHKQEDFFRTHGCAEDAEGPFLHFATERCRQQRSKQSSAKTSAARTRVAPLARVGAVRCVLHAVSVSQSAAQHTLETSGSPAEHNVLFELWAPVLHRQRGLGDDHCPCSQPPAPLHPAPDARNAHGVCSA